MGIAHAVRAAAMVWPGAAGSSPLAGLLVNLASG